MATPNASKMESAVVLRALSKNSVSVLLGTGAVVQAELATPLSPRTYLNAQSVNALATLPARVSLGPYDLDQHRFTQCTLEAQFPEASYQRVNYLERYKKSA